MIELEIMKNLQNINKINFDFILTREIRELKVKSIFYSI